MADASLRSRLEAAQARRAHLAGELARKLPLSAEHQQALAEASALSLAVSTAEGRLVEAVRQEDELIERRAGGWSIMNLVISATVTLSAAIPGLAFGIFVGALMTPLGVLGGAVALSVPLVINGLRWRRGRQRAELSRRVRAALG